MNNQHNFFRLANETIYFDERKQRYTYMENAPKHIEDQYKNSHFNHQRPDLTEQERMEWD